MALHLNRITYPYEFLTCTVSRETIGYGDFYFTDDEDPNFICKASVYNTYREKEKYDNWDQSLLNAYTSDRDYRNQLLQLQSELYRDSIFTRKRFDQEAY